MLGAAEPPLRRGFACGKTLVRRTRAAGQKAGGQDLRWSVQNLKYPDLPKRKTRLTSCLSFWVPAAEGGLLPSGLKCSGRQSRPSAEVLPAAKRSYAAPAPPALQAGLEILSLRVYFMAHATSN